MNASGESSVAPAPRILLLTHAETDLLALERARADLPPDFPPLQGASLVAVSAVEQLHALTGTFRSPGLVVLARIHGRLASVPGLETLAAEARGEGWMFIAISGVDDADPALSAASNVSPQVSATLTAYFMAGGFANVAHALRFLAHACLGFGGAFEPPRVMPAHGLYHPDLLVTTAEEWRSHHAAGRPLALVVFYRAHALSGNLAFVDSLVRALEARGFAAVGAFTSSLRDCAGDGTPAVLTLLDTTPAVVINTVSFPLFSPGTANDGGTASVPSASTFRRSLPQPDGTEAVPPRASNDDDCFTRLGAPFLQAIACGMPRQNWASSPRGLGPTETAVNIALPECDGRIIAVPVSFKERHRYAPDAERCARVAGLAARLAALRAKPNAEKRIAIILTNAGGKAARAGGAVGLDTPASLVRALGALRDAGYAVSPYPDAGDALMAALLARGSYDDQYPLDARQASRLARADYVAWFHRQPEAFQSLLRDHWGEPSPHGPTLAPARWVTPDAPTRLPTSLLPAAHEPQSDDTHYHFAVLELGHVLIALEPPRGFGVDPETIYHAPDLPPTHHYAAFHAWLSEHWRADAVIHFGKHGTLEWLPGKSVALSSACAPDALLGELPLFYPFVVNDPGEGAQAKRRAHAVILDHLVPPLTHAETHGSLATLARLVEETYRAESLDPSKLPLLHAQIWDLVREAHLETDLREIGRKRHGDHVHDWDERPGESGAPRSLEKLSGRGMAHLLEDLDAYLCELGRAQIRHGLHVFGQPPTGTNLVDLLFATLRCPNGGIPSLGDALARAQGRTTACTLTPREQTAHDELGRALLNDLLVALAGGGTTSVSSGLRTHPPIADRTEPVPPSERMCPGGTTSVSSGSGPSSGLRSLLPLGGRDGARPSIIACTNSAEEQAIANVIARRIPHAPAAMRSDLERVLRFACTRLVPDLARTEDEIAHLLLGLEGRHVPAGPSGAPSRGMAHVLPTGRNFYTVDPRGLPSAAAWTVGQALARDALDHYLADAGTLPESIALSIWGTATMRTGGDDVAQALALYGMRPVWHGETRRTIGLEPIPLAELKRPRIDVTLRVSGFFRDAFPQLMQLLDDAARLAASLDEPPEQNFIRKHWLKETARLVGEGMEETTARRRAGYRVFSSKPGAYGTGLLELIESRVWRDDEDLAEAFLIWGGWAYGQGASEGIEAGAEFRRRLATIDLALHNQDNREHDIFDSDDYFQFHGGLVATIAALSGRKPRAYFGDSSDPARPEVRTLQAEALRVYRSRVVNPKWLNAIRQHGYKGGLEMAATVDYLVGFSATADVVSDWMFEGVAENYAQGAAREFLQRSNPWALHAIAERLLEAHSRELWQPQPDTLARLRDALLASESQLEAGATSSP